MANFRKWSGGWTSRGTVLTTELNSLASGGYSALGTAYDNTTNGNQLGWLVLEHSTGFTPVAGARVTAFIAQALDGTNYSDAPSSTKPGWGNQNVSADLKTGTTITPRTEIGPILLPPGKSKVALLQAAGAAFPGTGNTVTLYTTDETNNG